MTKPATLPGIPEIPKRRRRRSGVEAELARTERRLSRATRGMGDSAGEMLKAAALQLVAKKLDEVTALLISIGLTPADIHPVPRPSPPPANRPDPLAQLEAYEAKKFGGMDANGKPAAAVLPGVTCQICGQPAVYRTKRQMTLCITHQAQGKIDDRDDGVRAAMAKGFGNPASREEIIEVPAGSIQQAIAEGNSEDNS